MLVSSMAQLKGKNERCRLPKLAPEERSNYDISRALRPPPPDDERTRKANDVSRMSTDAESSLEVSQAYGAVCKRAVRTSWPSGLCSRKALV